MVSKFLVLSLKRDNMYSLLFYTVESYFFEYKF